MERRFFSNIDKIGINNYLTIVALDDGLQATLNGNDCEYCTDANGIWKTLPCGTPTESINAGRTLSFRAKLTPNSDSGIGTFTVNKYYNLKGNCMSLLYADDAINKLSLPSYAFKSLFSGNDKLISAKELLLPATQIAYYSYKEMFKSCSVLVETPILPATNIGYGGYESMFQNCTSLKVAPKLPAMLLSTYSYYSMFKDCVTLTIPPELPATALSGSCYNTMFSGCISLREAPELPATLLANYCYFAMFSDCTSLIAAPELPATSLAGHCYRKMFNRCTSLREAPDLPATLLADYCYNAMFQGCISLISAPDLASPVLVNNCYSDMFSTCSKLNYIKMLAIDISAPNSLSYWLYNVAPTGTFIKNKNAEWDIKGFSGIPNGWNVITE